MFQNKIFFGVLHSEWTVKREGHSRATAVEHESWIVLILGIKNISELFPI